LAWSIELSDQARKCLLGLDKQTAVRIFKFLHRVEGLENPRSIGEALNGSKLGELWKYRAGDYRIIADIQDKKLRILVVRFGNRKDVYRK
jgi:mRNA interferase RelE/StbE